MNLSNINLFRLESKLFPMKKTGIINPVLLMACSMLAFVIFLALMEVTDRMFPMVISSRATNTMLISALVVTMVLLYRHYQRLMASKENEYKQLFRKNPHPMWIYDTETERFLMVNEAAKTLYGYTETQFLGMSLNDIILENDVPAMIDSAPGESDSYAAPGCHWSGTWRHKKQNGGLIYVEISSNDIFFEGRKAALVLSYDVTEKVTKDLELQTMNQELEKKILQRTNDLLYLNKTLIDQNRTIKSANIELTAVSSQLKEANRKIKEHAELKNKFISMVSHEFRTPLASINFGAGYIKKYYRRIAPEGLLEKAESIEKHVAHMNALLNDVLTIGNNDAAKIQANYQALDLQQFISKIVQEVECANKNSHGIKLSLHGTIPAQIHTDEKLLRNIFINLLNNGIKYSPGQSAIDFNIYGNDHEIIFEIRDKGIGISREDQEKIFEPFYRINNGVNIEGTGLGLSIVKRATELIGAKLVVESEVGKGSMFGVVLPVT